MKECSKISLDHNKTLPMTEFIADVANELYVMIEKSRKEAVSFFKELKRECTIDVTSSVLLFLSNINQWFYIPYLPALHSPGWLLRYLVGPHNIDMLEMAFYDIWAGITVALTLIPQALSYAKLANLPPVNGLYTAVLPSAFYTIFGSSLQLSVGPVALVSLLMGQLVIQYGAEPGSIEAVDLAGETALCVGFILTVMSVLKLGNFIRFISHPVMSGFTTAAAILIGMNQLKNAFGFTSAVPQQGQEGYDYNYQVMQWFLSHWWDHNHVKRTYNPDGSLVPLTLAQYGVDGTTTRNYIATALCFGFFFPLIAIQIFKNSYKPSEERKKTISFRIWNITSSLAPVIAIIIGARIAYLIHKHDHFNNPNVIHHYYSKNLKIVGPVTAGIDIFRAPSLRWDFLKLLGDVFPLTLIAFMESYSVAHRIATLRNELHILNANQEMWAIGVANYMASISSAYPIAGSFSRSSLNATAGARTPLSKAVTMCVIILCLCFLTKTFEYIPQAVLAAVIWSAIYNLVAFGDFWHAFKHSKKDFLVMLVTAVFVFVFDTGLGLAVGLLCSALVKLSEDAFCEENKPTMECTPEEVRDKVNHVVLHSDLNFITSGVFSDFMQSLTLLEPVAPHSEHSAWGDRVHFKVSSFLDRYLKPTSRNNTVKELPHVIVLDFKNVKIVDITALLTLEDAARVIRLAGVRFVIINTKPKVTAMLVKYHIGNDRSDSKINLDIYLTQSTLPSITHQQTTIIQHIKHHKYSVHDDNKQDYKSLLLSEEENEVVLSEMHTGEDGELYAVEEEERSNEPLDHHSYVV